MDDLPIRQGAPIRRKCYQRWWVDCIPNFCLHFSCFWPVFPNFFYFLGIVSKKQPPSSRRDPLGFWPCSSMNLGPYSACNGKNICNLFGDLNVLLKHLRWWVECTSPKYLKSNNGGQSSASQKMYILSSFDPGGFNFIFLLFVPQQNSQGSGNIIKTVFC